MLSLLRDRAGARFLNEGAAPRPIVRAVLKLRTELLRLADAIVPPQVALLDELAGVGRSVSLHVVAKHRIADHLAGGPRSKDELASATGLRPELLERVMSALVAAGFFVRGGDGRYENNRLSSALVSGREGSMRAMAEYFADPMNLLSWAKLDEALVTGEAPFERVHGKSIWAHFAEHRDKGETFGQAMSELTAIDAPTIAAGHDFGRYGTICDVAGGRGTLLSAILAKHPRPRGILFDEAHVLEEARGFLAARGVEGRVERVPGSFFEHVPAGADAYLLKDILHDWDDERCVAILRRVREAMGPRARVLVCELPIDHQSPEFPAPISDLQMLVVCSGGRQRSEGELRSLFRRADLTLEAVHHLALPMAIFEGAPA